MARPPQQEVTHRLSAWSRDGSQLQVDFHRDGDRFVHDVCLVAEDGATLACWSEIQPSDSPQWPASPPIQELATEIIAGRDVLLGLGRAGKCHWSVSIEVSTTDDVATLRFDIACRCPEEPQWLGSTYRTQRMSALSVCCEDDTAITTSGPFSKCEGAQVSIVPSSRPQSWPGTVRWRYHIAAKA